LPAPCRPPVRFALIFPVAHIGWPCCDFRPRLARSHGNPVTLPRCLTGFCMAL
jgi:hypothetical protein